MKEDGSKERDMVKVITKTNSQTKLSRANLSRERNKATENWFFLMEAYIKENFIRIVHMEEVLSNM